MLTRVLLATALLSAGQASAQVPEPPGSNRPATRAPAAEFLIGHAGFVDDAFIDHLVLGGQGRIPLGARLSVGPELTYMRGPGDDRDLFLTGNVFFDLIRQGTGTSPRVIPYLVAGGGLFRNSNRFGASGFSYVEGAVTGGGGVRVMVTPRMYVTSEVRLGWEPHIRVTGGMGFVVRETTVP